MPVHMSGGQKRLSGVFCHFLLTPLRQAPSLTQCSRIFRLGAGQPLQSCLSTSELGLQVFAKLPSLSHGCWDLSSSPYDCKGNTKPVSHPSSLLFLAIVIVVFKTGSLSLLGWL